MRNFEAKPFVIRSYGKTELARLYLPNITPRSALATFRYWIEKNPMLQTQLAQTGLTPQAKLYTPLQVRLIVRALGAP